MTRRVILVLLGRDQLLSSRSFRGGRGMAYRSICVALLLSSLPLAGCGTVANLVKSPPHDGAKTPFGGVRQDLWCIEKAANGEPGFGTHPEAESGQHPCVALMILCAADLPLSLVGDVVTWPYTAAYSFINQPVPVPPVTLAPPILTPPVTLAPPVPASPAGRTQLLAQVIAAQALAPLTAGAAGFPQVLVGLGVASLDAAALAPPAAQAPAEVRPQGPPSELLPEPRKLP
jgi:uncharacterized protein YceK